MELIITAITLGVIGNFHCIGMCGPIAISIPIDRSGPFQKLIGIVIYNLGRIFSYISLGGLFGLFGAGIRLSGIMQLASIVIGSLMLIFVLFPRITALYNPLGNLYDKFNMWISQLLRDGLHNRSGQSLFIMGGLNGLLPCGMTFTAALASVPFGGVLQSMSFMLFFGIGTLPVMILLPWFAHLISAEWRYKFRKLVPLVIGIFGILFILRGLNLGIPFISPDLETVSSQMCGDNK